MAQNVRKGKKILFFFSFQLEAATLGSPLYGYGSESERNSLILTLALRLLRSRFDLTHIKFRFTIAEGLFIYIYSIRVVNPLHLNFKVTN